MSKYHSNNSHNILPMFIIMFIAGLCSTMNIFANKISDIKWSLNDIYMITYMIGIMFILSGIYYNNTTELLFGFVISIIFFICIRTQLFITKEQFILGMIPHHSMAVFMSEKLLNKNINDDMKNFISNIINTQNNEIEWMKNNQINI